MANINRGISNREEEYLRHGEIEEKPQFETLSHGVLELNVPEKDLLRVLDMKQRESEDFFDNKLNLGKRRKKNNDYWRGKQIDYGMFHRWQVPYVDNVIYRDVETILPIAVSKVPDIIVSPASEDPEKIKRAKALQSVLDFTVKQRHVRQVLRKATRHSLLDFIFVIKARWDKLKQSFVFEAIQPDKLILDHTAMRTDFGMSSEAFDFIGEWIEEPLKVVISKFPNKKQEILDRTAGGVKQENARQMANKIRYQEIWFTWHDDNGIPTEALLWRYKDLILDKMRNPYWDYEGQERAVAIDPITGNPIKQTIQFNHFDMPKKPYIIMNYQYTGVSGPIDDTTPVEQALPLQDVVNKRGRQITELADKANPKKIISAEFISKEDAVDITDDPGETIVGEGSVRDGFTYVPGIPPNPVLFQDLVSNRLEIDNIIGAHATTRGERVPEESGIARQITREGDFGRIDDMVLSLIEPAADEMANWMVHFMKVFGTQEHFAQVLGEAGKTEFVEFDRDSIDDGLNITVKASTVDKTERRATATQLASAGSIDPLSLMEDLDAKNPIERAKRMIAFQSDPSGASYMQLILGDQQGAQTLQDNAAQQAPEGGAAPAGGIAPPTQAPPTEVTPPGLEGV
ncbi:hypothetical protein LCGC14_0615440 [marine sediment metagenome]|uniref:Portal protein n=1 Tax=marine sediment metagenome TaxID=412755 RepID=A0A0F9RBC3_9ZZZZ|nr:hypothetical protein [bacterium]